MTGLEQCLEVGQRHVGQQHVGGRGDVGIAAPPSQCVDRAVNVVAYLLGESAASF